MRQNPASGVVDSSDGRRQITVWAMLFLVANVTVKAAYAVGMLLLATMLLPAEYASYGLLYAVQGAATTLAAIGLVEVTAGRLRNYTASTRPALFQNITGLFFFTAAGGCVLLLPVALWLGGRDLGLAAIPAALLGVVTAFSLMQASFHRIDERHAVSLVSSAGVPLVAIVGILAGALIFGNLLGMFGLALLAAGGVVAWLAAAGHTYGARFPDRNAARIAAVEILPFLGIGLFGWASGYGMTLVVDWRFQPIDVASYVFLYTAASISQVVASSLNMVWAPRFYQIFNSGDVEGAERRSGLFFAVMALLLGSVGFLAASALPWLTWFIGGNLANYGTMRLELILLLVAYVLATPFWHYQNFFLVAGRGRELMSNTLWSGAVGLAVWIGCMLVMGPGGIYLGFLLQMAIKSLFLWQHARRSWPVRPWWIVIAAGALLPFASLLVPAP